jgi:hypothetical protein
MTRVTCTLLMLLSGSRGLVVSRNLAMRASTAREAAVEVRDAGAKGMGAFAAEPLREGAWVGSYRGTLCTHKETTARYSSLPESERQDGRVYVFELDAEYVVDAQNETHFSRFFNHAEFGTLTVEVDVDAQSIDFFAARDVDVGEELTFDYGYPYWRRSPPSACSDSRNFSAPFYQTLPPELTLLHPPPIGTHLPLTPLTVLELRAALMLPEAQSLAALLRTCEFFGAGRTADGAFELRMGVADGAEAVMVAPGEAVPFALAQAAAVACITQARVRQSHGLRTEGRSN